MIKLLVSGFQDGADMGGVLAAHRLKIPTGGRMPKGFKSESGLHPEYKELYGAEEMDTDDYPSRTKANVLMADCVVWFGDKNSPGGILTHRLAKEYRRSVYDITPITKPCLIWMFIYEQGYKVMIAGNRESKSPGIQESTRKFLIKALEFHRPPYVWKPSSEPIDDRPPCVLDVTLVEMMGPTYYLFKNGKPDLGKPFTKCPGRLTGAWHDKGLKAAQSWIEANVDYLERFG